MLRSAFLTTVLMLWSAAGVLRAQALKIYVSPDGNDHWTGRLDKPNLARTDGPVASLGRARDLLRASKPQHGAEVLIAGGKYFLNDGVEFKKEDSGTATGPIVYRAQDGQGVHLIGGREVRGFSPVKDPAILARLSPGAREHVLQVDLKAQGITDFGRYRSRGFGRPGAPAALEVFFRNEPMTLARWPNQGFVKIAGIPHDQQEADEHGGKLGKLTGGFLYEGDEPGRWKDDLDVWVHGYWAYDWANSYERVASIDTGKHLIKTAPPYGIYGFRKGQRLYFLNILEELDSPGEWYLDRASGILYFWPPAPLAQGSVFVSIVEQPLIRLHDVSHVTFRGLTVECSRGDGIRIEGGSDDAIDRCTIRNVGDTAVVVHGGANHQVTRCDIYNPGDGGISLSGGDRKTLTPAHLLAENNRLHHIARWSKCYQPAIDMSGVGNRAAHNLIYDHPHCGILLSGNDHVIEFNEIHHVCLETGDVGAIYMGRDYTYRGNVIRYNYIHDTGGVGMGSMGVYMDDCVSGTTIYGNLFKNVQRAVFLGGGRDFRVENNVFIDCKPAVQLDARGLDKTPVWHDMVYQFMRQRLAEMHPDEPPYSIRYPELTGLKKFYASDNGIPPGNITIAHNISVGGKSLSLQWHATRAMVTTADNLVDADPHFVDPSSGNYQLRDDSPAFKLGFKRIPIDQIGPIQNPGNRLSASPK
ncbi:MAG TPA: right-handed parallel beta-helix repeat-containing protein [Tepidisphaeraceae bacterium]|nr:right-handed parallel beta-helix repeat-containing protein [Tepidisphaeraceae bacterium]